MSDILRKVDALLLAYRNGELGGERMPEDANPGLDRASKENYMYFTPRQFCRKGEGTYRK